MICKNIKKSCWKKNASKEVEGASKKKIQQAYESFMINKRFVLELWLTLHCYFGDKK